MVCGVIENDAPASTRPALWLGRMWPTRDRNAYDKMIAAQMDPASASADVKTRCTWHARTA